MIVSPHFKRVLLFVGALLVLIFCLFLYFRVINRPEPLTFLPAPILKDLNKESGGRFVLLGVGYPKAKVLVYINDKFVEEAIIDNEGNFSKNMVVTKEGETVIKVKQIYKNIESEFTSPVTIKVDLTAPDVSTFKITTSFPKQTNKSDIALKGKIAQGDVLLVNEKAYNVNKDGTFNINYKLSEGTNTLTFKLADKFGNETSKILAQSVYLDSMPPTIKNYFGTSCSYSNTNTEEVVDITIGDWQGYQDSITSTPIVGCVSGNLASLTVDGKKIKWDENGEVYQRINLMIHGGLNKYKVIAIDKAGNKSSGYIETTSTNINDSIDVNLNY